MDRTAPAVAPGVRGFDSVLAAEPAEGAGGDPQGLAGVLVARVYARHAFDPFFGDLFHIHPPFWMHMAAKGIADGDKTFAGAKKKAANSLSEPAAAKKKTVGKNPTVEKRSRYLLNLQVFPQLQDAGFFFVPAAGGRAGIPLCSVQRWGPAATRLHGLWNVREARGPGLQTRARAST